jgi:hypothetical protein
MRVYNYSPRSNNNPTTMAMALGWLTVYYSYRKAVALRVAVGGRKLYCRRRDAGSRTTGVHIGYSWRDGPPAEWFEADDETFDALLAVVERRLLSQGGPELADELAALMGCPLSAARV